MGLEFQYMNLWGDIVVPDRECAAFIMSLVDKNLSTWRPLCNSSHRKGIGGIESPAAHKSLIAVS